MSDSNILLDVSVAGQSSEVIIIDSGFHVIARGIHSVQLRVPPGIYRAKVRVGDQQSEKLFSVEFNEPNGQKSIKLNPLEFSSPIPLYKTSTSREFHQDAIRNAAAIGGVKAQLGKGAEVVIFLRDLSSLYFDLTADQMASYKKNFEGLVLSKLDGSDPHPLESIGTLVVDRGYLIASATVTPGSYALSRMSSGTERLFLPLVVPSGWSLQVFVSMVPTDDDSSYSRLADFDGAAMVFDRPDAGFFPDRSDLGVLEVTRQALARGHNVLDANAMAVLLSGKVENPMMGLLAAHLLLLARKPNLELIQKVVTNTGILIGANYPDLLVLSWKLGQLRGTSDALDAKALVESIKGPPMLQLSWRYFMEAYLSLVDKGMLDNVIYKMSSQLVSSSVWVSWLDSVDYQTEPSDVAEDTNLEGLQVKSLFSISPEEDSSQEVTAAKKSRSALNFWIGEITKVIRWGAIYLLGKLSNWLLTRKSLKSTESSVLKTVLENMSAGFDNKLRSVEAEAVAGIFETLVEQVDWKSVVRQMKSAKLSGKNYRPLSPLQRQLLLSLKAAREQFEDDGKLPRDTIWNQQRRADVPIHAIIIALRSLVLIAKNLGNVRLSSLAKALVQVRKDINKL